MPESIKPEIRCGFSRLVTSRRGFLAGGARAGAGLAGLALLNGCTPAPPPADLPRLTFAQLPRIGLDVARFEVRDAFKPSFFPPHVEHKLAQPPYEALKAWAKQRINPVGNSGEAVLVIHDASIVEAQEQSTHGWGPLSYVKTRSVYNASFAVRLDAVSPYWDLSGYAEGRGTGQLALDDGMTLDQRERLLVDLVERTINDLDRAFVAQLHQHLSALIAR